MGPEYCNCKWPSSAAYIYCIGLLHASTHLSTVIWVAFSVIASVKNVVK